MTGEDKKFIKGEIGGLARIIKGSFDTVDKSFESIDKKFETMEENNDQRYKAIIERFGTIEADIKDINTKLGPFASLLGNYELRLRRLERRVGVSEV